MSALKRRLIKIATGIEESFDSLSLALRTRLKTHHPIQIVTYRTYGTHTKLHIKGRVLKDKGLVKPTGKQRIWSNLLNMYKRFQSDEVPGAVIAISSGNNVNEVISDREGYFSVHVAPAIEIDPNDVWREVAVEMTDSPFGFERGVNAVAEVLIPSSEAEYGVISDIDDTVIKTSATSLISMARNTFFHNAHTRMPFAGVSEFYKSLQLGRTGKQNNPFFYVSSSPWNLYDLLIDFLDLNEIPAGPLMLRDFGLGNERTSSDHQSHKLFEIGKILNTYQNLKFVLIGDSGQEDASIYREVVARFPGRILAVYIRDVQLADRQRIAIDISKAMPEKEVEMVIVDNTIEAAEHAAKLGLIFNEAIPKVIEGKRLDKGEVSGKVPL